MSDMVNINDIVVYERLSEESRKILYNSNGVTVTRVYEVDYTNSYLAANPSTPPLDPEEILMLIYDPTDLSRTPISVGDPHPILTNYYACYVSEIRPEQCDRIVRVTVVYTPLEIDQRADLNGEVWEFNYTGQERHITSTTFGQVHYPSSADFGWVIGADGEEVHGCDAYRAVATLKVTQKLQNYPNSGVMRNYMAAVAKTNSSSMAHDIIHVGEALFVGFNVNPVKPGVFLQELNFLISPETPAVTFTLWDGSTVGPLTIGPWQYVWFRHQGKLSQAQQGQGYKRQKGIESVHIATIYQSTNLVNLFGLSGPTY